MLTLQPTDAFAGLETAETLHPAQIEHAQALRDQLTLDEKFGLMHGQLSFWAGQAAMAAPGGYSSQVWIAGEVPRLGFPGIRFSDGPRGVVMQGATTFPVSMARGATWDAALEGRAGDAIGEYIPPDVFAEFLPTFPPPGPQDQAFAQSIQGGSMDTGMGLGGDRERLSLHPRDEALIQAVAAANPRTAVAGMAGSAVITEAWHNQVQAILMLWYPGMEGGHALADVLLGRVSPSGKLRCSFPARVEDLPFFDRNATEITYDLWHGYRKLERDGAAPAFPFGFGLSYTTFDYAGFRMERTELNASDTVEATVEVTNAGAVAGEEVVQLYVSAEGSNVERAPKELKAFARVALVPGETRTVHLSVPATDLAFYDHATSTWRVEPITYTAIVGRHALDPDALQAAFRVI